MKELLMIAIGSALVNNVVLSQFLGICPFIGVSKKIDTAAGMGGAGPDMGGAAGGPSGDDNVVDADFEVVDEDENEGENN